MQFKPLLTVLLIGVLASGCGTMIDMDRNGPRWFGGVQHNWQQVWDPHPQYRLLVPLFLIDMPGSFLADCLLLPASIAYDQVGPDKPRSDGREDKKDAGRRRSNWNRERWLQSWETEKNPPAPPPAQNDK